MNPVYCKFSDDRDEKFQIKTSIYNGVERYVEKVALSDKASEHIKKIYSNYVKMTEVYKNSNLKPNKCSLSENGIRFEFLNGITLEKYLDQLYFDNNYLGIVEVLKNYKHALKHLKNNIPFRYTKQFESVFGTHTFPFECESLYLSNIDLIFENIILNNDVKSSVESMDWTIIDYEWVFEFPIPIDFIIYRALYYYIHGNTKREKLIELNLFMLLGITEDEKLVFEQMENNFQRYVAGSKYTLSMMKYNLLKRTDHILSENKVNESDYLQIYLDSGEGYLENKSIKSYYTYTNNIVEYEFKTQKELNSVRFDLASRISVVYNLRITVNDVPIAISEHNAAYFYSSNNNEDNVYCFSTDDSQVIIKGVLGESTIKVSYYVNPVSKRIIDLIIENYNVIESNKKSIAELMNEIDIKRQEIDIKSQELDIKSQQLMDVSEENAERGKYIEKMQSYFYWRVLRLCKRTVETLIYDGPIVMCKRIYNKLSTWIGRHKNNNEGTILTNNEVRNSTSYALNSEYLKHKDFSKREKILVVVHEAQKAGATLLSINIIQTVRKITEYEPIILLLSGGPLSDEIHDLGLCYELNQPDFTKVNDEKLISNIISEIESIGVKYALCNSVVTGLVLPYLKNHGIKTITMVHELPTSIFSYNFVNAAKNVQTFSDDIVFPSQFVQEQFLKHFAKEVQYCHIIPQGVYANFNSLNINEKIKSKAKLCKKLNIEKNSYIVMGCGYGNLRKGLDLFEVIASQVILKNNKIHFVWVGDRDPELMNWINCDLRNLKIEDHFHWVEFVENLGFYFGGADVFLLSSREDPFPSVALDAMVQYTPVIAFNNAGGIPDILGNERGIIVPYGRCDICADEILTLLDDREKYMNIVTNAKNFINDITPENYLNNLLKILVTEDIKRKEIPNLKVSVIIPNYNYEKYIPERLNSILNQTVRPYEIIFLDDVSKDNSVQIAKDILEQSEIKYKIIQNEINQGCFKQWLNGIHNAEGDIIWIAEADDTCKNSFIQELLPFFADDQVNLAYAQSEVINEFGEKSGFVYSEYTSDLSKTKWLENYINNGEAEIIEGLGIKNTIPNASGVLIRKSAFDGIDSLLAQYSISGDWFAYIYVLRTGKIAFCSNILNYHRRHSASIIYKREQDIKLFYELLKIKQFIADNFLIPMNIADRFLMHVKNEYSKLMPEGKNDFNKNEELLKIQRDIEKCVYDKIKKYSFLNNINKKNILFVMPDFEMGGGQTLVIRLANYFSKFHNVFVYNARPWLYEERIEKMFSEKVCILQSQGDPSQLKKYIVEYGIDIINDHIWWSDKIVYKAACDLDKRIVLSMHGCYEGLLQHPEWDNEFDELSSDILNRADAIIYATDKNKKIFEKVPVLNKAQKIYYGYELESIPKKERSLLNITEDSFIFGLVARGIKEKGFSEAIDAFKKLCGKTEKRIDLILIGNGPYIDELVKLNGDITNIHFINNLKKPSEWIGWVKNFDCALLPTYFISESLPNSIIEYLAYGCPVISTDIGDIQYMLKNDNYEAGIILPLDNGCVNIDDLEKAMDTMLNNNELYMHYKQGADAMFLQFDMRNFADRYYRIFMDNHYQGLEE